MAKSGGSEQAIKADGDAESVDPAILFGANEAQDARLAACETPPL
jgi:hypothetical protein